MACAAQPSTEARGAGAAADLQRAVAATLAAKSFHADVRQTLPDGVGEGTVDYEAPDREDSREGTGKDRLETITIGTTLYVTDRPGFFNEIDGRGRGAADALSYLHFLEHAQNVRLDG
ncbi:MAG TPA: hypothetical protein VLX89_09300, partial [Actinomycetota bacterium]|nr:hypothetical protein [Actinomycetota bacterium]